MTRGNQRDNNRERARKQKEAMGGANKHTGDQTQIMAEQAQIMREKQKRAEERKAAEAAAAAAKK